MSWLALGALAVCGFWLYSMIGFLLLLVLMFTGIVLVITFIAAIAWAARIAQRARSPKARLWALGMVALHVLAVSGFFLPDWDAISSRTWFSLHESGFVALGDAYDHRQLPTDGTRLPPRFRYLWAAGKASWSPPDQPGDSAGLLISTRAGCQDCTWSGFYYLPGRTPNWALGARVSLGHGWWWIHSG